MAAVVWLLAAAVGHAQQPGCASGAAGRKPLRIGLSVTPHEVASAGRDLVAIRVRANAGKADQFRFTFTTSGGHIRGKGAQVTWDLSGTSPGVYTITAQVDDNQGCTSMASDSVTVAAQLPARPAVPAGSGRISAEERWVRCSSPDPDVAIEACTAAIASGTLSAGRLVDARLNRGLAYLNSRKDYLHALADLRPSADAGRARAQNALGVIYSNGYGVPRDYAEAIRWYRLSIGGGETRAEVNLADLYQQGLGVTKDLGEAFRLYRSAADNGNPLAQARLGWLYGYGIGVQKDVAEAIKWTRLAAQQGEVGAEYDLGLAYAQGVGVAQDYGEALHWFRLAADRGHAPAHTNIGIMYQHGYGVAQDYARALQEFHFAADSGEPVAMKNLGFMYSNGWGVARDQAEAAKWYRMAADKGDVEAAKLAQTASASAADPADAVRPSQTAAASARAAPPGPAAGPTVWGSIILLGAPPLWRRGVDTHLALKISIDGVVAAGCDDFNDGDDGWICKREKVPAGAHRFAAEISWQGNSQPTVRVESAVMLSASAIKVDHEEGEQYWCVAISTTTFALVDKSDRRCHTD